MPRRRAQDRPGRGADPDAFARARRPLVGSQSNAPDTYGFRLALPPPVQREPRMASVIRNHVDGTQTVTDQAAAGALPRFVG